MCCFLTSVSLGGGGGGTKLFLLIVKLCTGSFSAYSDVTFLVFFKKKPLRQHNFKGSALLHLWHSVRCWTSGCWRMMLIVSVEPQARFSLTRTIWLCVLFLYCVALMLPVSFVFTFYIFFCASFLKDLSQLFTICTSPFFLGGLPSVPPTCSKIFQISLSSSPVSLTSLLVLVSPSWCKFW